MGNTSGKKIEIQKKNILLEHNIEGPINLAVIGECNFTNYDIFCEVIDSFRKSMNNEILKFITGCSFGTDYLSDKYAKDNKIETLVIKPDWKKESKGNTRFIVNKKILKECNFVILFMNKKSKLTNHAYKKAKKYKLPMLIHYV
jgi:hypothetical protein